MNDKVITIFGMAKMPKKRRKPAGTANDTYFQFRLSTVEKQAFTDAATADSRTLAGWIKDRLRRIAREELQRAGRPDPFLV
jgi:hypothetical protein